MLRVLRRIPAAAKEDSALILVPTGVAASRRVRQAFLTKSQGGTDETGARWAPLARSTIERRLRKKKPTTERPSSALSPAQREKWWAFYRRALSQLHDKGAAARVAWVKLKRVGGVGHYDKYGASGIPILRDTEALYESLVPGAEYNIFRVGPGILDLGTTRPGAAAHHSGGKNLPQRRLWPPPDQWTSAWWQEILLDARAGLVQFIVRKL